VSAAIALVFLLAMLYLTQATAVSTAGYEVQRLQAVRDELRRQNALLAVENARLDSPARIEAEAKRIGLVRAASIQVVKVETVAARR
jgi:cell division protein FtsL